MFYYVNSDGTRIPFDGSGLPVKVVDITAAKTLTIADSGTHFSLNAAAGVAITLPAVSLAGCKYRFTTKAAFATTNFTIVAASNKIQGGVIVNSVFVPAVNENTISFVATAETIGDFVEVYSDGVNWYVTGVAAAAGAVTVTEP
jgi:hypothetical protein